MTTFTLPDLGEGLQEAEIVAWLVEPDEHVVADQPILSVETDKAVVEIPAPYAGRIARLHAAPGDMVAVGAPLVDFDDVKQADSGAIAGELPREAQTVDEPAQRTARRPAAAAGIRAAPAVRAHARALGIDLAGIAGSGPGGAITTLDVDRAAHEVTGIAGERLHGVRRAMARKMAQSHREIAPATVCDEADVEDWAPHTDVTARLIRAIAAAAAAQPALNAWYDGRTETRQLFERIDLGIAVNTEDGLFVPVMHDIGGRGEDDLRRGMEAMKAAVAARDIPAKELRGATLTLSNFGVFGAGRFAALVIVPPQVAIIGAGGIKARMTVRDGAPAVRRLLPLSLTFDHRVVSGGEAAGFLRALITDLALP
jgi:2-oxoisovalerate dehydrogenase E2 component (dihydrolipoyl transacylase)